VSDVAGQRPVDRGRWRRDIARHLEDFPRQYPAQQAFAALREAGVVDGELCRRLTRAQNARSMIEHSYVQTPAGNVHQTAELVCKSAREFIGLYRDWVEPYLDDR
jgi:hypothetical protein